MFTSTRSRITSMFAAAIGGSLLLVATPAGAFASEPDSPSTFPSPETSAVSESSPAETALLEQTTTDTSALKTTEALATQAQVETAAQAAADAKSAVLAKAKAAALAKKRAISKRKAAEAKKLVTIAKNYIGVRYKRGGNSPRSGFDCSGFTRYVYKKAGKSIPRTSSAQRHAGKTIARKWARPGDLVWFSDFRHVGIYAGNGYIIDAPKPGKKVAKRKLWTSHVKFIRVQT